MYFSCIRSLHCLKDISDNLDSSQLYVGGYTIFFPSLHLTIYLLRLRLSTPLRCNEMRLAGNLLSFCALYGLYIGSMTVFQSLAFRLVNNYICKSINSLSTRDKK